VANWQDYYKEHLVIMEEAAKQIHDGDNIWLGQTTGIPYNFLNKLHDRQNELKNVGVFYNFSTDFFDMLFDPTSTEHFNLMSIFSGPLDRASAQMGIAKYNSNSYEHALRGPLEVYGANTLVIEVCPPDENGYCNTNVLGAPTNCVMNESPQIKKRIAVTNKYQYPAQGDYNTINIPVTQFDFIVEDDHEISFIPVSDPTAFDKTIADYIMPYVKDGDTVQIGMGGLGEQITKELYTKKNIKIYTEITVDSMVPLVESGVVVEVITAGAYGSSKVFDFMSTSDKVTTKNINFMLDPMVIGQQDNLVAINCPFMVDLLGQACSEAQGLKQYSGVGGSFSYLYGATRSKGGRSFLCLRSTHKDADGVIQTNIVPWLPEGSIVTTPKYIHMYIVTEFGVANIFLKSNIDRIKALLKIANPDFQPKIKEQIISSGMIKEEDFND